MGTKASVTPVFVSINIDVKSHDVLTRCIKAAEVAPAHIRGSLVMNWSVELTIRYCSTLIVRQAALRCPRNLFRLHGKSRSLPSRRHSLALANCIFSLTNHSPSYSNLHLPRITSLLDEAPEILSCIQDTARAAR